MGTRPRPRQAAAAAAGGDGALKDKCQAIMEDVDQLDNIQDGFIHYQLIHFCQATGCNM
jgi:hypothetical protein